MSTATSPPSPTKNVQRSNAIESRETEKTLQPSYAVAPGRRHFWIRRVHSLLGLFFGGYVTVHLLVNATGIKPMIYQENVDKIHTLEPMLPIIEIVAIFIPLLFHALYGLYITKAGVKFNTTQYNYGGNVRYTLQRWTAVILLLFIAYHIATLHKWGLAMFGLEGYPQFNPQNAAYKTTVQAFRTPWNNPTLGYAVTAFYLLGTWSAVFHWANGLWTSAIAWGLTITAASQRRWGHFCLGFGIVMMIVGTVAWAAFAFGDPNLDTVSLPAHISRQVHSQATGGENTPKPLQPGESPTTSQPASH